MGFGVNGENRVENMNRQTNNELDMYTTLSWTRF